MSDKVTKPRLNLRKSSLSALPRMEKREGGGAGRESRLKVVRLSGGKIIR